MKIEGIRETLSIDLLSIDNFQDFYRALQLLWASYTDITRRLLLFFNAIGSPSSLPLIGGIRELLLILGLGSRSAWMDEADTSTEWVAGNTKRLWLSMVDDHPPCSAIVFEDSNQWDVDYYEFTMCRKLFKIISW